MKVNKNVCKTGKNELMYMVYSNEMPIFPLKRFMRMIGKDTHKESL